MKMAAYRTRRIAIAVTFVRMVVVFTHDEALLFGADAAAASLLGFGFYVGAVSLFTRSLLPWLGNMRRTLSQVLTLFLLLVNDFLVVRYISWIGHDSH